MNTTQISTLIAATCFALAGCAPDGTMETLTPEVVPDPFSLDGDTERPNDGELADLSGLATDIASPEHHVPGDQPTADQMEPGPAPGSTGGPDAPVDPDMPNWSLSVLVQDPAGDHILLLDDEGLTLGTIDTGTTYAGDFAWHEGEAFWVVNDGVTIHRIEGIGNMGAFTTTNLSWGWRMNITEPGGDIIIADEYEMQRFDSQGNHMLTSPYDSGDCYMDIAALGSNDILSLNVYGNSLDSWDFSANAVTPQILGVPGSINYIGVDDSGTAWMGGSYGGDLYRQDGDGTESVGSLGVMLDDSGVYGVNALEPASADSVYVLFTGSQDAIAEVDASGVASLLAEANGQVWKDLASR
ncbi:MAG: hypothetical protein GY898_31925 [Proteobacteria bacterium]|nr:hypothetical protein [Pseudomonadota bacterium]